MAGSLYGLGISVIAVLTGIGDLAVYRTGSGFFDLFVIVAGSGNDVGLFGFAAS